MKRVIITLILLLMTSYAQASCVILLHGLARTENSMQALEEKLIQENFQVVNLGYPSRKFTIELLAEKAIIPALSECSAGEINFVTHSLGGILVRQYLQRYEIPNLNRVVMLGPPNQGSEIVDKMKNVPGFNIINGKAGVQLGTGENSVPNSLGEANFDLGIIAGTRSINIILSNLIPGEDDGKVSVSRTKLSGMKDHITLPVTHTFMMSDKQVIEQVTHYLRNGRFVRVNDD